MTNTPEHLALNHECVPERALDPPAPNEYPCWDCVGPGMVTKLYDVLADEGWFTAFGTRDALAAIKEMLQERWSHETCNYHLRRGGVS